MRTGVAIAMLALGMLPMSGCKRSGGGAMAEGGQSVARGEIKSFSIHGKIVSVDAKRGAIVLNHDAVPGFMDAMTMTYPLKDPSVASELHSGDMITATLLVRKVGDGYEDPQLDQIVIVAQASPDYRPAVDFHVPQAGDAVPDFRLLNEDGRTIHLGQFKGKVLLLTFIYTRCPLLDYCPRMNKNFKRIDDELKGDASLYRQTHLLSISFDPAFDTPTVLKSYGSIYNGGSAAEFAHWDFAAAPAKELSAVEEFFDVGVTPGESGTLNHSMSTAVIGKDGKIRAWYATNDWTTNEVLAQMKSAAAT